MTNWWGDRKENILRYGFEDIELLGDPQFVVGVPRHFDNNFKKSVFAAAKTVTLGNSSIDYTLRKYGDVWNFENYNDGWQNIYSGVSEVKETIISLLDYLMRIPNKPDRPSIFACSAALVRLQNTFKASTITIVSGLHFETIALERVILEQLAWIYTVHDKTEMNHFKVKPPKCITNLKEFLPYAGQLYGILSNYTHISPETTLDYLRVSNEGLNIVLKDLESIKQDLIYLLILCDMFGIIGEYIYSSLLSEYKFLEQNSNNGELVPSERRETLKIIRKYEKLLNKRRR